MSGDLLFQRGQGYTAEMWDDSELVAAWNRQQSAEGPAAARSALDARRDVGNEASESLQSVRSETRASVAKPPVPAWADEATVKLLNAWFEAGYWTGFKEAST